MRAVDIIRAKRDGATLSRAQIDFLVRGAADDSVPRYQLAAWLMAVWLRGLSAEETAALTASMVASGVRVDLSSIPGPKVDKHSTGGVGDKTSLVIAPMVAACGVAVPMMSGRGLGHTGGTLDKLESIEGFRTALSLDEFRTQVADLGCAFIGQTDDVAPADRTLYALRDVTATIESVPLICASILSKKIAEGIDALVLDVKAGRGAFMTSTADARRLAESLVQLAEASGLRAAALVTTMDAPLGRAVGNALEVRECLDVLRGEHQGDLVTLCIELAAVMLRLAGRTASLDQARAEAAATLRDGRALALFREVVRRQGGNLAVVDDPDLLPRAPYCEPLRAAADGYVTRLDARRIGEASMQLGAGRAKADDDVDTAVGIVLQAEEGDRVERDMPVLYVHYRDAAARDAAWPLLVEAVGIGESPPPPRQLVLDRLGAAAS